MRRRLAGLESLPQSAGLKVWASRDGVCPLHQSRVASLRRSEVVVGFCDFYQLSLILEVLQQERVKLQVGDLDLASLKITQGRLICGVNILHIRCEPL